MKVSVIIVSYNVRYFLEVCLDSVQRAAAGMAVEVIVVDNQSADDSVAMLRERFPQVRLIANADNRGFSRANNQAVEVATGDYVLFLNPDTVMPEDFLRKMAGYMDLHPEAGALGPRLIDGKGRFAPDGKKGFPKLRVALFKAAGLHRFFPKSPYFNAYYAAGVGERETAAVEVLSGCCMMVRRSILAPIGGAFDEDYFMYCEDVDLNYRISRAGYQNVYFPEVDLIHYKGESTRKATLTYIRVFNEALATFVRKHYSKGGARLFLFIINIGIVLRAVLGAVRGIFRVLKMPLFDALVLLATLWLMKDFWVMQVKNMKPVPPSALWATFPVYIGLWIGSLFLMGAYDKNYRALRVVRGMTIGTILTLAYYGLLGPELRYSRVIIMLSGLIGTVALLGLHELLYRLGIFKYVPYDALPRKAVIVANPGAYGQTAATLERVHYAPALSGRIAPQAQTPDALAALPQMKEVLYTMGVEEVIFCINGLGYEAVLEQMQHCGPAYDYKIHLPGSQSFVGSNSSHTSGDLYTADRRYNLSEPAQQRNKRTTDIVAALGLLLLLPLLLFVVKSPGRFAGNIFRVLAGKRSWVGYGEDSHSQLPPIRRGVLPPYFLQAGFEPPEAVRRQLAEDYAQHYVAGTDVALVVKNLRWLGR